MNSEISAPLKERLILKLEIATVAALQMLLMVVVVAGTIVLYILFARRLVSEVRQVESVSELLPAMQRAFAGVLIVLLGLELMETLKTYFTDHHVRLEVILVVAIIAVGRHVIQVDFEHTPGAVLLGLSGVITSLTLGYFLVKKAQLSASPEKSDTAKNDRSADMR